MRERWHGTRVYSGIYLGPGLGLIALFVVVPILLTAWVSFHSWNMLTPFSKMPYVGLRNYHEILGDPVFLAALRNTVLYSVISVVIELPLALMIGIFLFNTKVRGSRWVRTALFLPYVIPNVAVAIVWGYLYSPIYGPLNVVLSWLHLPTQPWLGSVHEALLSLIILNLWQTVGYYTVIVLAGLTEIPQDYYEAASLDGATRWQATRHITIPLLRRAITFIVIILTINSLQVFAPVYILTQGGPANSTNVVVYDMYRTAFNFLNMGQASAMVFILFLAILAMAAVELRLLGRST
ncbi:MAG: carbohydrate ABC transporter permease [Sulfobacillus sp.]